LLDILIDLFSGLDLRRGGGRLSSGDPYNTSGRKCGNAKLHLQ
jgi:hypothetical protein